MNPKLELLLTNSMIHRKSLANSITRDTVPQHKSFLFRPRKGRNKGEIFLFLLNSENLLCRLGNLVHRFKISYEDVLSFTAILNRKIYGHLT